MLAMAEELRIKKKTVNLFQRKLNNKENRLTKIYKKKFAKIGVVGDNIQNKNALFNDDDEDRH